jgi:hypothetical protein
MSTDEESNAQWRDALPVPQGSYSVVVNMLWTAILLEELAVFSRKHAGTAHEGLFHREDSEVVIGDLLEAPETLHHCINSDKHRDRSDFHWSVVLGSRHEQTNLL